MNKDLKFEDLPKLMTELIENINELRKTMEVISSKLEERPRQALSIDIAANMICKSKSTIYKLVAAGDIPYHKQGNRLYFFEDELIQWIANHKSRAQQESEYQRAKKSALEYIEKRRNKPALIRQIGNKKQNNLQ